MYYFYLGLKGDIGSSGLDGVPGNKGAYGDSGDRGLPGVPGPKGIIGDKGEPGENIYSPDLKLEKGMQGMLALH